MNRGASVRAHEMEANYREAEAEDRELALIANATTPR